MTKLENGYITSLPIIDLKTGKPIIWKEYSSSSYKYLPDISIVLNNLVDTIAKEKRKDLLTPLSTLFMWHDGSLHSRDHSIQYFMEQKAMYQLGERISSRIPCSPRGMPGYISTCIPHIRANNLNDWVEHLYYSDSYEKAIPETDVNIRTRLGEDGERNIFSAISSSYAVYDADKIAKVIEDAISEETKVIGIGFYDGHNFSIKILRPDTEQAGFVMGLEVKTTDSGGEAIITRSLTYDKDSDGFSVLPSFIQKASKKIHRGSPELMEKAVKTGIDNTKEVAIDFFKVYNQARRDMVGSNPSEIEEVFNRLTRTSYTDNNGEEIKVRPKISITGIPPQDLKDMFFNNWLGITNISRYTRADIYRSIIRTASKQKLPSLSAKIEMEEQSGLILNPNLEL